MLALKSEKSPGNLGVCRVQFHSGVNGLSSNSVSFYAPGTMLLNKRMMEDNREDKSQPRVFSLSHYTSHNEQDWCPVS